jgi:tRNA threonylcarbamoyladenosine biosynthesis protein TsaB
MHAPLNVAIETSTTIGSVALGRGQVLLAEVILGATTRHSEVLLPGIDYLLKVSGQIIDEIGAVIVGGGPGSFTGLRIAAATGKGFAHSLGVPLLAYSGLLASAAGCAGTRQPICALFDARRAEVYAACYQFDEMLTTILEPSVLPIDELLNRLPAAECRFTGEGAVLHAEQIRRAGGLVAPAHLAHPRASALLWLAYAYPELGRISDPAHWEPAYLRASGAERGIRG